MFPIPPRLTRPGLFITATDTGVGKTLVTCAIAHALRHSSPPAPPSPRKSRPPRTPALPDAQARSAPPPVSPRIGVCKPMASGCRRDREGLVNEDAEALAHFADCRLPLDIINPIRFAAPLAPAVAAEQEGRSVDLPELARSLEVLDEASDVLLVEGVGGLLVPLCPREAPRPRSADPYHTVLDLAVALGYPVVIVCRAGLGTLNHTAMTVQLLRQSGCALAGLVINGYEVDAAGQLADPSLGSNRLYLERMNRLPILATIPRCPVEQVQPHKAMIPPAVLEAVALTCWWDLAAKPRSASPRGNTP